MLRNCTVCTIQFETNGSRKRICSNVCLNKSLKDNAIRYRRKLPPREKLSRSCIICGGEFKPVTVDNTCSKECWRKKRRPIQNRSSQLIRRRRPKTIWNCVVCSAEFNPQNGRRTCSLLCTETHKREDDIKKQNKITERNEAKIRKCMEDAILKQERKELRETKRLHNVSAKHDKKMEDRRRQRNEGTIARQFVASLGMTLPKIDGNERSALRKQGRIAVAFLRELGIDFNFNQESEVQNAIT